MAMQHGHGISRCLLLLAAAHPGTGSAKSQSDGTADTPGSAGDQAHGTSNCGQFPC